MLYYIDPGTGSMLFAILIGIAGAVNYVVRTAIVKLRFVLSGGRQVEANEDVIPYVIFSDDKRYWPVFEPVCREFDRRGIDIVYFTASEDDPALDNTYDHVRATFLGDGNKTFAKLNMLKADLVLATTPGLDVYQWKRSKDVKCYVHIMHMPGDIVLYRMFGLDYYDAVLTAGERHESDLRALEKMRNLPAKDICMTGIPYMDEMVKRLAASDPLPKDERYARTVLLAPSWGPSAIFSKFGGRIIGDLLKTGYRVIVRPHPQSFKSETDMINKIMAEYPESDQLSWNRDVDNFECLRSADILISDFSGVIFDFALVYDKPIIYADTKFDPAPYDAWWLDQELWTLSALPRVGMQLTEDKMGDLREMIETCLEDPRFAEGRDQLREEIWQCRGRGAVATVDYLVAKHAEVTRDAEEASGAQELPGAEEPADAQELSDAQDSSGAEEPADAQGSPDAEEASCTQGPSDSGKAGE